MLLRLQTGSLHAEQDLDDIVLARGIDVRTVRKNLASCRCQPDVGLLLVFGVRGALSAVRACSAAESSARCLPSESPCGPTSSPCQPLRPHGARQARAVLPCRLQTSAAGSRGSWSGSVLCAAFRCPVGGRGERYSTYSDAVVVCGNFGDLKGHLHRRYGLLTPEQRRAGFPPMLETIEGGTAQLAGVHGRTRQLGGLSPHDGGERRRDAPALAIRDGTGGRRPAVGGRRVSRAHPACARRAHGAGRRTRCDSARGTRFDNRCPPQPGRHHRVAGRVVEVGGYTLTGGSSPRRANAHSRKRLLLAWCTGNEAPRKRCCSCKRSAHSARVSGSSAGRSWRRSVDMEMPRWAAISTMVRRSAVSTAARRGELCSLGMLRG